MANSNAPKGFVPKRTKTAASFNEQANLYYIPSTDGSAYYLGDAVISAAGADANGVPQIAKAAAGDTLRGVIVGFTVDPTNLNTVSVPATKTQAYYALVVDDPSVVFEIQGDSTALSAAAIGKNANFTVATPTSPANQSATVLDGATVNTTQALPLKIVGVAGNQDTVYGAYCTYRVVINQHELMGNTAGI